eukprot:scaffold9541_cov77-Cylindrotheca_fusiformis.AAC.2
MEKLNHVMQWRKEHDVPQLEDLVKYANMSNEQLQSLDDDPPEQQLLSKANEMVQSLNNNSIYWHGLTKDGHPILWLRTNRLPWFFPNVDAQINALILLGNVGIRYGMMMSSFDDDDDESTTTTSSNITEFVVIAHCIHSPPPNFKFAYRLVMALTKGFPDRLHSLYAVPVSRIVNAFMAMISPFLPDRLSQKLIFWNNTMDHQCQDHLVNLLLLNGWDDVPTFLGGPNQDHDLYYPEEKDCPNRGEGMLKFDFYGMKERLIEQRRKFCSSSSKRKEASSVLDET